MMLIQKRDKNEFCTKSSYLSKANVKKNYNNVRLLAISLLLVGQNTYAAGPWHDNELPNIADNYQGGTAQAGITLDVQNGITPQDNEILAGTIAKGGVATVPATDWDTGHGLQISGSNNTLTSFTNNGTLQGGSSSLTDNVGGRGANLVNVTINKFTNNGYIVGGQGQFGGDALYLDNSHISDLVNEGTIKGGERGATSGSAIVIYNTSTANIINKQNGKIIGGDGSGSGGNGIYLDGSVLPNTVIKINNEGGLIAAGNGGDAAIYVTSGKVNIINSGTISKGLGNTNAIDFHSSGNSIELQTGGEFDGDLIARNGDQTFIFNANKAKGENTFDLSTLKNIGWLNDGTAVTTSVFRKEGQYDWILTGELDLGIWWANTTQWQVNAGNLVVGAKTTDNTLIRGTIDVNNGATLSGFGTVTGAVNVNSGGTITAGYHSVGTMRVGQISFANNSTYLVDADKTGTDLIVVDSHLSSAGIDSNALGLGDGKAYIASGSKVEVQAGKGWKVGDYKILATQNADDVVGQFEGVHTNLAFLNATVENRNTNQEVWLTLTRNKTGFADIAVTRNQRQTASALQGLANNNLLKNQLLGLSALGALNAYDKLSGEIHASVQAALLNDRYVRDAINQHLIDRFENQGSGLWVTSWGATENLGSDNNAAKVSNNVFGVMVGADTNLNETTRAGIALGYQHNNLNLNKGRHSDAEIDSYHIAAYLSKQFDYGINLRTGIDYAYLNIRTDRSIQVAQMRDSNKDSYQGNLVQGFVEVSKDLKVNEQLTVEPYVNVAHVYMDAKFDEGEGVTALKGSGENQVTFTTSGLRSKIKMSENTKLTIGAGWQHAYGNRKADTDMKFNGGSYFNINGVPITKDATIADIGLDISLTPNASISANYQGQFGNKIENNAVKLGLNYKF